MSADKQQAVLDAAQTQFLRYGFRRVTMADIASAANMSRPALYLLFPNKEAIFNGVYARYVNSSLAEIENGLEDLPSVRERLAFAAEVWTIRPYELLHGTPEGRELADCSYDFAASLVEESYQRFEALVESILTPFGVTAVRAITLDEQSQVFALSLRGIKSGARDVSHLRALVTNLVSITVAALESDDLSAPIDSVSRGPTKRSK